MRRLWGEGARSILRALKQQPMTDDIVFGIALAVGAVFGAICKFWGLPQ